MEASRMEGLENRMVLLRGMTVRPARRENCVLYTQMRVDSIGPWTLPHEFA
jgi:hypothetical protein